MQRNFVLIRGGKFFPLVAQRDHASVVFARLFNISLYPLEVSLVNAGYEIRVVLHSGELLGDNLLAATDEGLQPTLGHKAVIGADT